MINGSIHAQLSHQFRLLSCQVVENLRHCLVSSFNRCQLRGQATGEFQKPRVPRLGVLNLLDLLVQLEVDSARSFAGALVVHLLRTAVRFQSPIFQVNGLLDSFFGVFRAHFSSNSVCYLTYQALRKR